jgi:hypothetical protein
MRRIAIEDLGQLPYALVFCELAKWGKPLQGLLPRLGRLPMYLKICRYEWPQGLCCK